MRATLLIAAIVPLLAGCVSKNAWFDFPQFRAESRDQESVFSDRRYQELEKLLATDLQMRDLTRAKRLIQELKAVSVNHPGLTRDLATKQKWVSESMETKARIQTLNQEVSRLKADVAKHEQALDEVRRTLVGQ